PVHAVRHDQGRRYWPRPRARARAGAGPRRYARVAGRRRGHGLRRPAAAPRLALLAHHDRALLGVHLVADARSLAKVPDAPVAALGEVLLEGLCRLVLGRRTIADGHAEQLLDERDV